MKCYIWFILILFSQTVFAGNFHAIGFFCTQSKDSRDDINFGVLQDYNKFQLESKLIANAIGYNYVPHLFKDQDFSLENAKLLLEYLTVNEDDVVMVYFDAHGLRFDDQKSKYPSILMANRQPEGNPKAQCINFMDYCEQIQRKRPRLLIGVVDACNNFTRFSQTGGLGDAYLFSIMEQVGHSESQARLRDLFLFERGSLFISAASPGQGAYVSAAGSQFSLSFFNKLGSLMETKKKVTWKDMLSSAGRQTSDLVAGYAKKHALASDTAQQIPFWDNYTNEDMVSVNVIPEPPYPKYLTALEHAQMVGLDLYAEQKYQAARDTFMTAYRIQPDNKYLKLYVFFCEAAMGEKFERFSTVRIENICSLLGDQQFNQYLKARAFRNLQYYFGISFLDKRNGCRRDYPAAKDWLLSAWDNGSTAAHHVLLNLNYKD